MDVDPLLLQRVLDTGPVITAVVAPDGTITYISGAVEHLIGYSADELVGTNMLDRMDLEWNPMALESIGYAMDNPGLRRPMLFRFVKPDGSKVVCEVTANNQFDDPAVGGLVVYVRTWDERFLLDLALEQLAGGAPAESTFALLVRVMGAELLGGDGAVLAGRAGDGFERIVRAPHLDPDLAPDAWAETPWASLAEAPALLDLAVDDMPAPFGERAAARGYRRAWVLSVASIAGERPDACLVVWRRDDELIDQTCTWAIERLARLTALILEGERQEARLRRAAERDPLTGLPNRAMFFAHLQDALDADGAGPLVGVLYVDLDGFKPVNDRLGHGAGDQVLVAVAGRLAGAVRDGDVVARLGGDEFAVVCPAVRSAGELEALAARIVERVREPLSLGDHSVAVGASVGIAVAPPGSCSIDVLVDAADGALYEAKAASKGTFRVAPPVAT